VKPAEVFNKINILRSCAHLGALELEGWKNTNIGITDNLFGKYWESRKCMKEKFTWT